MEDKIKSWLEQTTEHVSKVFENEKMPSVPRGTYLCGLMEWDIKRIRVFINHLKEYGCDDVYANEMRLAYKLWRIEQ